jgi:hypothetical protein
MLVIYIATFKRLILIEQQWLTLEHQQVFVLEPHKEFLGEQAMFLMKPGE